MTDKLRPAACASGRGRARGDVATAGRSWIGTITSERLLNILVVLELLHTSIRAVAIGIACLGSAGRVVHALIVLCVTLSCKC